VYAQTNASNFVLSSVQGWVCQRQPQLSHEVDPFRRRGELKLRHRTVKRLEQFAAPLELLLARRDGPASFALLVQALRQVKESDQSRVRIHLDDPPVA
jgi:hypothetical protein